MRTTDPDLQTGIHPLSIEAIHSTTGTVRYHNQLSQYPSSVNRGYSLHSLDGLAYLHDNPGIHPLSIEAIHSTTQFLTQAL